MKSLRKQLSENETEGENGVFVNVKFVKELLEFNEKKKASTSQIEKNVVNTSVNYNSNEKNEKIEEVKEIVEYKSNFFAKLIDKIKSWFYKF